MHSTTYRYDDENVIRIVTDPTGNCQLMSFQNFQNIIDMFCFQTFGCDDDDDYDEYYEYNPRVEIELKKQLRVFYTKANNTKALCIIDVVGEIVDIVETIFKGFIVSKTKYLSTNGSKMTLYIVNINAYTFD